MFLFYSLLNTVHHFRYKLPRGRGGHTLLECDAKATSGQETGKPAKLSSRLKIVVT
jgi:hypothetical protein